MLYADQKYDKTLEVMEALGIPTEDMPGATNTPAKPNTQNRGGVPKPNTGGNLNGGGENADDN
jgi:hypothetical protein